MSSARHRLALPVEDGSNPAGGSLDSITIEYLEESVELGVTERDDIERIGIDSDGDVEIDTGVADGVE